MTYGLSVSTETRPISQPSWSERALVRNGASMLGGLGFVKKWKVTRASPKVGMPMTQQFLIYEVTEPERKYFKIKARGSRDRIAEDWRQAELELVAGKLVFHFKQVDTYWAISLESDGSLHAQGLKGGVHPLEEPGEWDANEE